MAERTGRVKVFISWSGELSKSVAHSLKTFLPHVIQSLDPWVSDVDISKGTFWAQAIMTSLRQSRFGVVVLTNENVARPWLHYETGFLAHYIEADLDGLVSPLLVEVPTSSVEGPMKMLQLTNFDRADVFKLLEDFNAKLDEPLAERDLSYHFDHAWPIFEAEVQSAIEAHRDPENAPKPFNQEKVLTEILDSMRQLSRSAATENRLDVTEVLDRLETRVNPGDTVSIPIRETDGTRRVYTAVVRRNASWRDRLRAQLEDPHDGGDQTGGDQATE